METKLSFKGTGGELFKNLFVGVLLTSITFGIYYPWFLVALQKFIIERTEVRVGDRELRPTFTGTGGELFKTIFVGYLLTMVTFGIYLPWLIVKLMKFQQEHLVAHSEDRTYSLRSSLTGGELFKTVFVGYLLTMITFGIYLPWFMVKLANTVMEHIEIREDDRAIGQVRLTLTGGDVLKTVLVSYLLTLVTFGIYFFWAQVKVLKLFANGTELTINERAYRMDFIGTGGENFKVNFLGYLLTMITFGIYGFWYMANLLRFQFDSLRVLPAEALDAAPQKASSAPRRAPALDHGRPSSAPKSIEYGRPSSAPKSSERRPSPKAEILPAINGDRRAAWARAFLPVNPPAMDGPTAISIPAIARAESPPPQAAPAPARPTPAPMARPAPLTAPTADLRAPMPAKAPTPAPMPAFRAAPPVPSPRPAPPAPLPRVAPPRVAPPLPQGLAVAVTAPSASSAGLSTQPAQAPVPAAAPAPAAEEQVHHSLMLDHLAEVWTDAAEPLSPAPPRHHSVN